MRHPHDAGDRNHRMGQGASRRGLSATDTAPAVSPQPPALSRAGTGIHHGPDTPGHAGFAPSAAGRASGTAAAPTSASGPPAVPGAAVPGLAIPPLLSAAEVGAIFNRDRRTIRRWVRLGHLQPVRVGRALFFRADAVRDLVHGRIFADAMACAARRSGAP